MARGPLHVLQMKWQHVLFLSWPMDAHALLRMVPEGLELDRFGSKAWVSLVAFENVGLRPRAAPRLFRVDLPELNLRTYVKHPDGGPGVLFLSMDADGAASVLAARALYRLPYFSSRIRMDQKEGGTIRFSCERRHPGGPGAMFIVEYQPMGAPQSPAPGSLDAFLLERYCLYTKTPFSLARVEVEHAPWRIQDARVHLGTNTICEAAGLPAPAGDPVVHYGGDRDVVVGFPVKA